MPSSVIVVNHGRSFDAGSATRARGGRELLTKITQAAGKIGSGANRKVESFYCNINASERMNFGRINWNIQSGTGTVGLTINGSNVTTTWATSDTATVSALVTLINASVDSRVQYLVEASNLRATAVLTSVTAGTIVYVCGIPFTATSAATGRVGDFDISGTDTADATALANAINAHPFLGQHCYALTTTNSCFISMLRPSFPRFLPNMITATASTVAVSTGNVFAASNFASLRSLIPGKMGNVQTVAASGTGVAVGGARLISGTGLNQIPATTYER